MTDLLTPEELCFFKQFGYLIKRGAVPGEQCEQAVDMMWESAPTSLKRDDPSTWKPIPEHEASDDPLLIKEGVRWQYRAGGTSQLLIDFAFNSVIKRWAEQLLGSGTLREPVVGGRPMGSWGPVWPGGPTDPQLTEGVRGIYATLPSDQEDLEDHLHTDGHPFHLGVVCLLEDNPPNGGAFKVWPGSHRRFYPLFPMQYDQARIPFYEHMPTHKGLIHPPEYLEEVARVEADTPPVDCHGNAGDVVFWHHRMGHMAGHNTASPRTIRQALLFDYCKQELDTMRTTPPHDDMWLDWGEELRAADVPVTRQLAAEQRLPVELTESLPA